MQPQVIVDQNWDLTIDWLKTLDRSFSAWVFADLSTRRRCEHELAKKGITARIYSAYKPLVHYFLEDAPLDKNIESIRISYPAHPLDKESKRFLLEAYPLSGLLEKYHVEFRPKTRADNYYEIMLRSADGDIQVDQVFAPNTLKEDHCGQYVYSPCGWLKFSEQEQIPLKTDVEKLFTQLIDQVQAWNWPKSEPYFERLCVEIDAPYTDQRLGWGEEFISLSEALHEDVYFSLMELFTVHSGRTLGARDLQPGQIVPLVRQKQGKWHLKVTIESYQIESLPPLKALTPEALSQISEPLKPSQVEATFKSITGEFTGKTINGVSHRQLSVPAALFAGKQPGVVITAAQHANETSGTVGLLRALPELLTQYDYALGAAPLHNPEGSRLLHELRQDNPLHISHAARYTALGNDLQSQGDDQQNERYLRDKLIEQTGARLHLNLHGYPSHEWVRPFTGYSPRGFELWAIPKGFFLIMRHQSGEAEAARSYLEAITEELGKFEALVKYNQRQLDCYKDHAGSLPFELINGFACDISEHPQLHIPFELITEYPDEISVGADFRLAHETQLAFLRAAYLHIERVQ